MITKMAADSEILRLSNVINSKVAELDSYFEEQNVPRPSLAMNAPKTKPLPSQQQQTKAEILGAMDELKLLLQGPEENLTELFGFQHVNTLPALDAVVKYDIASKIKVGEEITYQELAEKCQLHEADLPRLMRMLVSMGLFAEPRKGVVTHNSCSRLLHDNSKLSDWLAYSMKVSWATSFYTLDAMKKWPNGQELNETAFHLCRGETFWEALKSNEDNARAFAAVMGFLQDNPAFGSHHLVQGLGWNKGKCPELMVDVGGHNGNIASDILRAYPIGKCIIQDQAEVVAAASVPSDLQGRLEFQERDLFVPQTVQADVYLLRSICHDWSDKYASEIITNLIPGLKPGASVIINEMCMPDPGTVPRSLETTLRSYDLCMKQNFNSKERSTEEWEALFQACDKRFKLSRVEFPPGSALAILEFKWDA